MQSLAMASCTLSSFPLYYRTTAMLAAAAFIGAGSDLEQG
jgi:hypothetical protein